jgi:hypothetical protein
LDRLRDLFVPLHRYRCSTLACGWEGTLRAPGNAADASGREDRAEGRHYVIEPARMGTVGAPDKLRR